MVVGKSLTGVRTSLGVIAVERMVPHLWLFPNKFADVFVIVQMDTETVAAKVTRGILAFDELAWNLVRLTPCTRVLSIAPVLASDAACTLLVSDRISDGDEFGGLVSISLIIRTKC